VTYGYREIEMTTDCYGEFVGVGVCGWIDLGKEWRPLLATEKDGINDGPARDALMEAVYARIEPLLQEVDRFQRDLVIEGVALSLESMFDGVFEIDTPARRKRQKEPESLAQREKEEGVRPGRKAWSRRKAPRRRAAARPRSFTSTPPAIRESGVFSPGPMCTARTARSPVCTCC